VNIRIITLFLLTVTLFGHRVYLLSEIVYYCSQKFYDFICHFLPGSVLLSDVVVIIILSSVSLSVDLNIFCECNVWEKLRVENFHPVAY
jgi:hypothetical protein